MSKLYGSTNWRRVLALVLVFVMMLSTMGSSGYAVFALDNEDASITEAAPDESTGTVVEPEQEASTAPDPGEGDDANAPPETPESTDAEPAKAVDATSETAEPAEEGEPAADPALVEGSGEGESTDPEQVEGTNEGDAADTEPATVTEPVEGTDEPIDGEEPSGSEDADAETSNMGINETAIEIVNKPEDPEQSADAEVPTVTEPIEGEPADAEPTTDPEPVEGADTAEEPAAPAAKPDTTEESSETTGGDSAIAGISKTITDLINEAKAEEPAVAEPAEAVEATEGETVLEPAEGTTEVIEGEVPAEDIPVEEPLPEELPLEEIPEPVEVTVLITGNSDTVIYNGEEQSVSGYEIEILGDSDLDESAISGPAQDEAIASGIEVGTYPMGLSAGDFSVEDEAYDVTFEVTDGELIIDPAPVAAKKVIIHSDREPVMEEGDIVHLTSELVGFEDAVGITYQWYVDKGDGFEPVEDATEDSYEFEASVETLSWSWRLSVHFTLAVDAAAAIPMPTPKLMMKGAKTLLAAPSLKAAGDGTEEVLSETEEGAEYYSVEFITVNDEGQQQTVVARLVDVQAGETIGVLPENPFRSGYIFEKWVLQDDPETEVTTDTEITGNMVVVAVFSQIKVYEVTIHYYFYSAVTGEKIEFDDNRVQMQYSDAPKSIQSPASVHVNADETHDHNQDYYYAEQDQVTITKAILDTAVLNEETGRYEYSTEVQYIPFNVTYTVEYMLKKLDGTGYDKVSEESFNSVMGNTVTPAARNIAGGDFDYADSVTLTEDNMVLHVYYNRKQFTVSFNTSGGDYIAQETVTYGETIDLPSSVHRDGYTFVGWYETADFSGDPISGSYAPTGDITLHAKWEKASVNYSIVYMIENANDNDYSYLATVIEQAEVDSEVTMNASTAGASGTRPGELDVNNFTFKESTTETVKADGTTVVVVKYNRNVYTISWNGDVYRTNGERRARNQGSGSVTAKYGATITQQWVAAFNTPYPDYAWSPTTQNNDKVISVDTMPGKGDSKWTLNGTTFTLYAFDFSTTKTQTLNYWLENYEGTQTTTRDGKTYGLYKSVTGKFNYLYDDSDFYQIAGYTKDGYTATYEGVIGRHWESQGWGGHWVDDYGTLNYTLGDSTPNADLTVHFYYAAQKYPLTFYDYDGTLLSTEQVSRNADISSKLTSNIPDEPPVEGATWRGWFTDAEHTSPYSGGTKMPEGLVLYGDWTFPTFTFTYYDQENDNTAPTEFYVKNDIPWGTTVSAIDGPTEGHAGYIFLGWYTNSGTSGTVFDFANKPITEDTVVYAHWQQPILEYTVYYQDAETHQNLADPYTVSHPNLKIGKTITEEAIAVPGMLPDEGRKSITLGLTGNVITFEYSRKVEETTYTVRYLTDPSLGIGELPVAEEETFTVSGDTTLVVVNAAEVNSSYIAVLPAPYNGKEFHPVNQVDEFPLGTGENIFVFYYVDYKVAEYTIHYVDMDGEPLAAGMVETGSMKPGSSINLTTDIDGWTYDHARVNGYSTSPHYTVTGTSPLEFYVYFKKDLTITATSKEKNYDGTALTVPSELQNVTVSGNKPGHNLTSITLTGSQTDVGSSPLVPSSAEVNNNDANYYYNIVYVNGELKVNPLTVQVTITGDIVNETYDGEEHTAGYSVTSISNSLFKEEYIQFNGSVASISQTDVGHNDLILTGLFTTKSDYSNNFSVTYNVVNGSIDITQATLHVYSDGATKTYDGTPLTAAGCRVEGLVNGETLPITASSSRTDVGETWNDVTLDWANATAKQGNYTFVWHNGKLVVEKASLTITAKPQTYTYNGEPQGPAREFTELNENFFKIDGLAENDTFTNLTLSGSKTAAGVYANEIKPSALGITYGHTPDSDISELTLDTNYDVAYVNADLTIEAVDVVVAIIGANNTADYDGNTHTVTGYTVDSIKIGGEDTNLYTQNDFTFTPGTNVQVNAEGKPIASRDNAGTSNMGLEPSQFNNINNNFKNVTFNVTDGYQTINKINAVVTITGAQNSTPYDGNPHTVKGFTATADIQLYDVEGQDRFFNFTPATDAILVDGQISATQTDVGKQMMGLAATQFANANSNFETVTFNVTDGYQEITAPDTLTVTLGSKSYTYDGNPHALPEAATTNAAGGTTTILYAKAVEEGEPVWTSDLNTLTATEVADSCTILVKATNPNYSNTAESSATLTITKKAVKITVNGSSDTQTYTGSELTSRTSVTATSEDGLFDASKFSYTGATTITETNVSTYTEAIDITKASYDDANLDVTFEAGTPVTFTIAKKAVKITVNGSSDTQTYTGSELTSRTSVTATSEDGLFDASKFSYTGATTITETNVSTYTEAIDITKASYDDANLDVTFEAGTPVTFTIAKKAVKITVNGSSDTQTYTGSELTSRTSVTATSEDGLFDASKFSYTGATTITETNVSTYTEAIDITKASYDDANLDVTFEAGTPVTFTIAKKAVKITVNGSSDTQTYTGSELTSRTSVTATSEDGLFDASKFSYTGATTITETNVSTYTEAIDITKASYDDANLDVTFEAGTPVTFTIAKKAVKITVNGSSDTQTYTGSELTSRTSVTATSEDGLFDASKFSYTGATTITETNVSTYTEAIDITKASYDDANLDVTFEAGTPVTFTIAKKAVKITVNGSSDTQTYTGSELTSRTSVTATSEDGLFDASKFSYTGATTITETNVSTYTEAIDITKASYDDANLDVTFEAGTPVTFTIAKKAVKITVNGSSDTQTYTGSELTSRTSVTATSEDGLFDASKFSYTGATTITETNVSTYTEAIDITKASYDDANLDVTFEAGTPVTFTIAKKAVKITVNGSSDTQTYTGSELTSRTSVTATSEDGLFDASKFSYTGATTITETNVSTYTEAIDITKASYDDANLDVTFEAGTPVTFTIAKKAVKITVNGSSDTQTYTGSELTSRTSVTATSEDGLFDASKFSYTGATTITETNVSTYTEAIDITKASYDDANLDVTFEAGTPVTFTIAKKAVKITVNGSSDTQTYTGSELTSRTSVTATSEDGLFDASKFSYTGATTITETNVSTYTEAIDITKASYDDANLDVTFEAGTPVTFTIAKKAVKITVNGSSDTQTYTGSELTSRTSVTATSEDGLFDASKFSYTGATTITETNVSTYTEAIDITKASYDDANLDVTFEAGTPVTFTIAKKAVKITVNGSSDTQTYTGSELTSRTSVTATSEDGLFDASKFSYTGATTITETNVSTYTEAIDITKASYDDANLDVTFEAGTPVTFTIAKKAVKITVNGSSDTQTYTGSELTSRTSVTATSEDGLFDASKFSYTGATTITETNVSTYTEAIDITKASYDDANLDVTFEAGTPVTFTIAKKAVKITVNGSSDTQTYTGSELTSRTSVTATSEDGLFDASKFSYTGATTITETNVSTYTEAIDITKASYDDANLDVTFEAGTPVTFTIAKKAVKITVNGSSDTQTYTGSELTSRTSVTATSEDGLFDASKFSYTGATTITETNVSTYTEAIDITKASYDDANLDVTFEAGTPVTFTIAKKAVKITVNGSSDTQTYTGSELTSRTSVTATSEDGLFDASKFSYTGATTITETNVSTYTEAIDITKASYDDANLDVTFEAGTPVTFTIAKKAVKITVNGSSDTQTYTGSELTSRTSVTATSEDGLFDASKFSYTGATTITETNVSTYTEAIDITKASYDDANLDVTFEAGTPVTFTIAKKAVKITVNGSSDTQTYTGSELTSRTSVTATSEDGLFDASKFSYTGATTITETNVSTYTEAIDITKASYDDANLDVTFEAGTPVTFTIAKKAVKITVNGSSDTQTYTGSELTSRTSVTATSEDGLFDASKFSYTGATTITETNVSTYTEAIDITKASYDDANLDVTFEAGTPVTFTIAKKAVKITVNGSSDTQTYTGSELTSRTSVTATSEDGLFDASKFSYTGATTITETNVSTYTEAIDITKASYDDANLDVTFEAGTPVTFTIAKKAVKITVNGSSDTQTYTGSELTSRTSVTATSEDGLFDASKFSYTGATTITETNVSTYTEAIDITKASYDDANLDVTFEAGTPVTFTIAKKAVKITVNGSSDTQTYTGSELTSRTSVTATSEDGLFDASKFSYTGATTITETNVSTYTEAIDITKASYDDANLDVTFEAGTPVTFTIAKKAVKITVNGSSDTQTYTGSELTSRTSVTATSEDGLFDASKFSYTGATTITETNVSTYTEAIDITKASYDDANLDVTFEAGTDVKFNITPASADLLGLTAEGYTGTYDGQGHSITAAATVTEGTTLYYTTDDPATQTADGAAGVNWSTENPAFTHVNETPVTVYVKAENPNYETAYANATVTINKKDVTITVADGTKVYGDADPEFPNASITEYIGNELETIDLSVERDITDEIAEENVGTYEDVLTLSEHNADGLNKEYTDYNITIDNGNFTITKAKVVVTAENKEKVYNTDDPEFTWTVEGLKREDSKDVLSVKLSREAGENVGTYTITPAGDAEQGNYDVEYKTGTLTITKADDNKIDPEIPEDDKDNMTVSGTNFTVMYDGKAHTATAVASKPGSTIEYKAEGSDRWSEQAPSLTNVGKVTFEVRATNPNYETVTAEGYTLEVTKRNVELVSETAEKVYDGTALTAPNVTVNGDGFVEGEVSGITATGTVTEVGSVTNTITYTEEKAFNADNYTITKKEGTLTITKSSDHSVDPEEPTDKDMTVTGENFTVMYDGEPHTVTAKANRAGSTVLYRVETEDGWSEYTTDAPTRTDAGVTKFQVKATNPNYDDATNEKTYTLEVTKRPVTLESETAEKTYDGTALTAPNVTVSGSGFVEGEVTEVKATGTITNAGEAENAIAYTAGEKFKEANYEITLKPGTLSIKPAAVTVTANDITRKTGEADPELTVTVTGLVGDDTVDYTVSRETGDAAGTYKITVTGDAEQGNYTVTFVDGTFTIEQAADPTPDRPDRDRPDRKPDPVEPEPTDDPGDEPGSDPTDEPIDDPETPLAPGTTDPEPVEEPTEIVDDETPLAPAPYAPAPAAPAAPAAVEPTEDLEDNETPLAPLDPVEVAEVPTIIDEPAAPVGGNGGGWALLNLIFAGLSAIFAIFALTAKKDEEDEDDEESEERSKKHRLAKLGAAAVAVAAIVTYLLTEDMSQKMVMVDQWTLLMGLYAIGDGIFTYAARKGEDDSEQENA